MNTFAAELQELIEKYRDSPVMAIEEIIDALESATEALAEEVNARN